MQQEGAITSRIAELEEGFYSIEVRSGCADGSESVITLGVWGLTPLMTRSSRFTPEVLSAGAHFATTSYFRHPHVRAQVQADQALVNFIQQRRKTVTRPLPRNC